jgi:hypothetical protein
VIRKALIELALKESRIVEEIAKQKVETKRTNK